MRLDIPKIIRIRNPLTAGIAILCGIAACVAALAITVPPGPGLDPDSASYLGAAESLAAGKGYRVPVVSWSSADSSSPLSHFPPGFSTAIALPVALGASAPQSARFVEVLAAGLTLGVATYAAMLAAGIVAGLALAAALVFTSAIADLQLSVLSEPLFIACFALLILSLARTPRTPAAGPNLRMIALGGIIAGVAVLVRYAGIAATGAIGIWALAVHGRLRHRVLRAGVAVLPTAVLAGAWVLRTHQVSGPGSIRELAIYGDWAPTLKMGRDTIVHWLVPWSGDDPLPGQSWIALAVLLALLALLVLGARALARDNEFRAATPPLTVTARRTFAACGLLAGCYVVVLVLSRSFADPGIPFDGRILAPLLFLSEMGVAVAIAAWWRSAGIIWRIAVALGLLVWGVAASMDTQNDVSWALEHGVDFASEGWRQSEVLQWARTEGHERPLYSNWPVAIYFHLHRHAWDIPDDEEANSTALHAFAETLSVRRGALLAFDTPSPGYVPPDSLARALGLRLLARFSDGSIFIAPPADSFARAAVEIGAHDAVPAVASRRGSR